MYIYSCVNFVVNKKRVITGVLMGAIFVMIAFVPAADNMHSVQSNKATGNISPQVAIGKYVVNKSQPTITTNSNLSNKIAVSFSSWYMKNRVKENLPEISSNTSQYLFMQYLNQSIAGKAYISQLTANEKSSFNKSNKMEVSSIESILHSGHKVPSVINGKDSMSYVLNIMADLPGGVSSDSGTWVMVTINYFVYHAPWWLGGWTVTYGEQDDFNELWAGSTAQKEYNSFEKYMTLDGIASGAAASGLTGYVLAGAIGGSWGGPVGTIVGAVVGIVAGLVIMHIDDAMTKLYESTYANEPSGNKYIWTYMMNDYYYPWITVVGSLASSIGFYGHLSNGNTVTIFQNTPLGVFGGVPGVVISGYFSSYVHYLGNKYGENNWVS